MTEDERITLLCEHLRGLTPGDAARLIDRQETAVSAQLLRGFSPSVRAVYLGHVTSGTFRDYFDCCGPEELAEVLKAMSHGTRNSLISRAEHARGISWLVGYVAKAVDADPAGLIRGYRFLLKDSVLAKALLKARPRVPAADLPSFTWTRALLQMSASEVEEVTAP